MKWGTRYIPSMLSSIPIISLSGFIKNDIWISIFSNSSWFLVLENITLSLVVLIFIMNIQRFIGKYIFENCFFKNGNLFPTTKMLAEENENLSEEMRLNILKQIKKECEIEINENIIKNNYSESIKRIKDAVSVIRKKVGRGDKTFQYNISYGFFRNLIAGTIWALPVSIINIIIFIIQLNIPGIIIFSIILSVYFILLIFSKKILQTTATTYAETLFHEYINISKLKGDKNG